MDMSFPAILVTTVPWELATLAFWALRSILEARSLRAGTRVILLVVVAQLLVLTAFWGGLTALDLFRSEPALPVWVWSWPSVVLHLVVLVAASWAYLSWIDALDTTERAWEEAQRAWWDSVEVVRLRFRRRLRWRRVDYRGRPYRRPR